MEFKIGEPVWWMQNGTRVDGRVVRSLGGGKYDVKKNVGGTWEVDGADLNHVFDKYPINSRACNDRVKGHFVWFSPWSGRAADAADRIVAIVPGAKRLGANLVRVKDGDSAEKVYDLFRKAGVPARDLNIGFNSRACNGVRSRNAVVAKALNACARNGGIDDFKVGDRVMVRSVVGFTPTDPKPGTVTAIYKSDNRIAVKKDDGGSGLFDASMVTKNACGTARNADGDLESYYRLPEWQKANSNLSQAWKLVNATIPLYRAIASKAPDAGNKRDAENAAGACWDILGILKDQLGV